MDSGPVLLLECLFYGIITFLCSLLCFWMGPFAIAAQIILTDRYVLSALDIHSPKWS